MQTKAFTTAFKLLDAPEGEPEGKVEAYAAMFGNVDRVGDRIVKGAFQESLANWDAKADPIPVVFSHQWGDLWSHIGVVDKIGETAKGLKVNYSLDVKDNPAAAQVFRLLQRRSITDHSFAYDVLDEAPGKDGVNELKKLDLLELGPTLIGANPATDVLSVKSAAEAYTAELKQLDTKVGRRLSQATATEMQVIHDQIMDSGGRMKNLLGIAEEEDDDGKAYQFLGEDPLVTVPASWVGLIKSGDDPLVTVPASWVQYRTAPLIGTISFGAPATSSATTTDTFGVTTTTNGTNGITNGIVVLKAVDDTITHDPNETVYNDDQPFDEPSDAGSDSVAEDVSDMNARIDEITLAVEALRGRTDD